MNLLKNILTVSVVSCILLLHPSLNKGDNPITYFQYLVYGNSFHLDLSPSVNKHMVNVLWKSNADRTLIIYEKGKKINDIPFEEGDQKLAVYYQNKLIGEIMHHKSSRHESHQYNIRLSSKNNAMFFSGEIIGPSGYKSPSVTIPRLASL